MKTSQHIPAATSEGGSATVIFLALLAIMVILVTAESRSLTQLKQEEKFLEQQQIKRLNDSAAQATTTARAELP